MVYNPKATTRRITGGTLCSTHHEVARGGGELSGADACRLGTGGLSAGLYVTPETTCIWTLRLIRQEELITYNTTGAPWWRTNARLGRAHARNYRGCMLCNKKFRKRKNETPHAQGRRWSGPSKSCSIKSVDGFVFPGR